MEFRLSLNRHTHSYVLPPLDLGIRQLTVRPARAPYDVAMAERTTLHSEPRASAAPRGFTMDRLWAFVAVAVPTVSILGAGISTIDLVYQVRAGDVMLHTRQLLDADTFSFTATGRPWLNQQWGAQVILAGVFRAGGWAGLMAIRAILAGVIFFFLFRLCRETGARDERQAPDDQSGRPDA